MHKTLLALTAISSAALASSALAAPEVVVSLKPIHSLVASVMKGIAEPQLILKGAGSPHTYQMKPADAQLLQNADLVFWVGPDLEKFLEKPIESLAGDARVIELEDAPGLIKLPMREGGSFEPHDDGDEDHAHEESGHGHEDNGHGEHDAHLWLNTDNAKALAKAISTSLSEVDPANAPRYQANLVELDEKLDGLANEIKATVAPVKDKPIVVFHDAYQYFEKQFGIHVAGSITVSPESLPGAARITEIHDKLARLGAACVFSEPQFEPKLVNVVIEGTSAKTGTLDPEAATLAEGPDLYFALMRGIAGALKTCLTAR
ncbi:zinc ABC transporter substrate-binding protein [Rhizobium sp.]